jgi:hypothetical protein
MAQHGRIEQSMDRSVVVEAPVMPSLDLIEFRHRITGISAFV